MCSLVVRNGDDARVHYRDNKGELHECHTLFEVYSEMLAQCMRDYPGLPDPRTMTLSQIRWCYEWLRPALKEATRTAPPKK